MGTSTPLTADALDLSSGPTGPAVEAVQTYLSRFGWLRLPGDEAMVIDHQKLPESEPGHFDDATESGLVDFQRFHRLAATGRTDAETLALMRLPRCGVPDRPPVPSGEGTGTDFVVAGRWTNLHPGFHL